MTRHRSTPENSRILAQECLITDRLPSAEDSVEIGFFEKNSTKWDWHGLEKVTTWNFQQGCMLQWLTDDEVIFNQKRNGNLFAKIINLRSGKHRFLPAPVYSLSSNRSIAYSVDFQSLGAYRKGYGYAGFDTIGSSDHRRNGISELDVNAGTERLVISHQKLIDLGFIGSTDKFWIDHFCRRPTTSI